MTSKHIFAPGGTNDSPQAQQYTKGSLEISQLDASPFTQFDTWFKHATAEKVHQPETVTLSTAELPSGRVSARMVYLKEMDDAGFVKALRRVLGSTTGLVVAHRASTVLLADRVALLQDGTVTHVGDHRELLATVPAYRELLAADAELAEAVTA